MRVADYKELRVYGLAFDSAMEIFQPSRTWPADEKYSLTDQIRRSSRSVCANIAEAWRKRRYTAAFISKLSDRDGEAAETEVHLDFAFHCGYLPADKHSKFRDQYDHICCQLRIMMDAASTWCGGSELREVPPEYVIEREGVRERAGAKRSKSVERPERKSAKRNAPSDAQPRSSAPRSDAPRP